MITVKDTLNEDYEVYSFGSNLKGQLGLDEIKHLKDVSKVSNLSNYSIPV